MSTVQNRWQRDVQIFSYPLLSAPFIFWSVLAVFGLTLSLGRLFTGLWFTGMSDDYAWGVWKTFNVMTLTALGSGGLAVGLFAYVFGQRQLHVVMRTALSSSLLFYGTGMLALSIDVGRPYSLSGKRALLNPGSVGQPRDGDPRAAALLLDTDAESATWVRIPYDIERAQRAILDVGLPKELAARLARGR